MLNRGHKPATLGELSIGRDCQIEVRHRLRGGTNAGGSSDVPVATKEQLRAAFKVFDTDRDGFITKEELVDILTRDTGKQALSTQEAEEVFAKADKNNDGTLQRKELPLMLDELGMSVSAQEFDIIATTLLQADGSHAGGEGVQLKTLHDFVMGQL